MTNSPIWRPFTQMKTAPSPPIVVKGEGIWLYLEDGQRIMDCISSWWVTIHGHGHPILAEALYYQAQQLEQVIFAGFSHQPAEQLAAKLLNHLPQNLSRVFFSDNGSTAVEVAIKIAYQYWQNLGQPDRTGFIGFEGGYHGDTFGAMAIAKTSTWWQRFEPLLFKTDTVPYPAILNGFENDFEQEFDIETKEKESLQQIELLLAKQVHAAIIIEPLIQGSSGMRICRPIFLQKLAKLAHTYQTLLIYDEVMTGFGRTGELFACLKSQTEPDLICLSKGLSGGCMPLAVTVATEQIYQAFYSDDPKAAFYHGHSFTGNPLACATGLASLKMLEQNPLMYQKIETLHWQFFRSFLQNIPYLQNFRTCGTIAAMEIVNQSSQTASQSPVQVSNNYFDAIAPILKAEFLAAGFLIRPLGNTIYVMPPYCIKESELEMIYQAIATIITKIVAMTIQS